MVEGALKNPGAIVNLHFFPTLVKNNTMATLPSTRWTLQARDFWKGAILAVAIPSLQALYEAIQSPPINWHTIGTTAAATFIAYLLKNFATNDVPTAQATIVKAQQKQASAENKGTLGDTN